LAIVSSRGRRSFKKALSATGFTRARAAITYFGTFFSAIFARSIAAVMIVASDLTITTKAERGAHR
jgi:hypothetical protein